ncbi:MAG: hypothetical protein AB1401_12825 [Thermodesulfobacteriota bacterium]
MREPEKQLAHRHGQLIKLDGNFFISLSAVPAQAGIRVRKRQGNIRFCACIA